MEIILFVVTAVAVINYFIACVACIAGNSMILPIPILHFAGVSFSNIYVSTLAIAYQVYFWSVHFGLFA